MNPAHFDDPHPPPHQISGFHINIRCRNPLPLGPIVSKTASVGSTTPHPKTGKPFDGIRSARSRYRPRFGSIPRSS